MRHGSAGGEKLLQSGSIERLGRLGGRALDFLVAGDRADDDSTYGLSLTSRLSRKFSLSLSVRQLQRDSNSVDFNYDEGRADLSISYAVLE